MMRFLSFSKFFGRSSAATAKENPPTTSPVPWVAVAVWADWSRRPVAAPTSLAGGSESPIGDPVVGDVTDDDRRRAPRRPLRDGEPISPVGSLAEHAQLLKSTPPASIGVYGPFWPVCCKRLTTLIHCQGAGESLEDIERVVGRLDFAFVEANSGDMQLTAEQNAYLRARGYGDLLNEVRRNGGGDGYGVFECRKCGRTYVAIWEP